MRCLERFFVALRQRFLDFFPIKLVIINDDLFPKRIPKRRLILLEDDGPYAVAMLCPCGCGDSIAYSGERERPFRLNVNTFFLNASPTEVCTPGVHIQSIS